MQIPLNAPLTDNERATITAANLKQDYDAIWRAGNDAGNGFAVGGEDDDINEIPGYGALVIESANSSAVSVYLASDGALTIVGNAHGPWAVRA